MRPLRAASLKHHREQVRRAASALVRSGTPIEQITSLKSLTSVEAVKISVGFLLDRYGGPTVTVHMLASALKAIAQYFVKCTDEELAALRRICRNVATHRCGLTRKNRDRLRPFDDPHRMDLLITLPQALMQRARMVGRKRRAAALEAGNATAIEILLVAAPRISNLAGLRLGRHVLIDSCRPDHIQLVIDEDETKNKAVLDIELPPESGQLLRLYVERFLPKLAAPGSDALFPNRCGGTIRPSSLAKRITDTIREATG